MNDPRVRALLLFLLAITFGVLIFGGTIIHRDKPPIPAVVRAENGQVVFTSEDVKNGQKLTISALVKAQAGITSVEAQIDLANGTTEKIALTPSAGEMTDDTSAAAGLGRKGLTSNWQPYVL
jgi:hypothetical protein